LDHPFAADVCVVGAPHPYSGEVPIAFVVLTAKDHDAAETNSPHTVTAAIIKVTSSSNFSVLFLTHSQRVAVNKVFFKHLHHVVIMTSVPKIPSDKSLRRELRDIARKFMPKEAKL
jgi:4-coumarate--CoA ligase